MSKTNRSSSRSLQWVSGPDAEKDRDGWEDQNQPMDAFIAIYRQYLFPVFRYFWFRVGDRCEAEDLTGQVFLAVLESLPTDRSGGSFAAWIFGIARHKAADHFRRLQPQGSLDERYGDSTGPDELLCDVIDREELIRLEGLVRTLKPNEQELLRLRFAADLSFDEIATVLRKRPSAVKMQLYRLLRRVERDLGV